MLQGPIHALLSKPFESGLHSWPQSCLCCGMADSETAWSFAVPVIIETPIALFFNGIYVSLAVFALYFLHHRAPAGNSVLICAIAVMFIFATTEIALQIATAILSMKSLHSLVHAGTLDNAQWDFSQRMSMIVRFVGALLLVTNNAVTDCLLIYRCYVIWGTNYYKKKVVISPLLLLITGSSCSLGGM
ncbi:hypothetical protein DFH09DRAFT_1144385 [Mycena vulgaris]|nr:hypothetical protein DFH09DRAFT_1144385 [Mycena vulgaris]